jgi:hypothetical protein
VVGLKGAWALGMPTSTFAYTAVFAAGLAMDANTKRDRNTQWSAAFEHLQDEIDQTVEEERGHKEEVVYDESGRTGEGDSIQLEDLLRKGIDWDTIYRVSGMELEHDILPTRRLPGLESKPELDLPEQQSSNELENLSESYWHLLPYDSRFPSAPVLEWPANTGPDLVRHNLPPQSLWAPEHMRWRAVRKRQAQKKLVIQELSVGMLIHALLGYTHAEQLSADALASLSPQLYEVAQLDEKQRKGLRRRIKNTIEALYTLHKQASPKEIKRVRQDSVTTAIPQYFQDIDGDFYSICNQMNIAIKNIIYQDQPDDYGVALATAKICHNLLVSSAAPDLQTINMLIAGFGRWKRPELVDAVIATREACKIRPNEITCAAVLNHYIQTDRPDDFSKFVGKMRAVGNGLMLARPDVIINERSEGRLVRFNEKKVKQKVYPTPMVFNTLMLGVLKFAGFDRAVEVYYDLKGDAWGMDVLGLSHFLEDCIRRADWEGGSYIWEEISSIKRRVRSDHMSNAYAQMLSLCSVTGKTIAFNQVLSDLVRRGFDRKRILSSAIATTQLNKEITDPVAPPWTADNVLIAVSSYLGEHGGPGKRDTPLAPDGDNHLEQTSGVCLEEVVSENPPERIPHLPAINDPAVDPEQSPAKDAEEAWAVWMQHELGEPVIQSPKRTQNTWIPGRNREQRTSTRGTAEERGGDTLDGSKYSP